ncbi:MAG TPA: transglutaminase-like domain-containing protein [Chloroflexota bacterium]
MRVSLEENRQEFETLVRRPDADIDLAAASLLIARHEYPELKIPSYLHRIDEMAATVMDLIGSERHPITVAGGLSRYLFCDLGLSGAVEEYFDPRASYLSDVIDRGRGIPITLSVLYMEVARRAGFKVDGVGLPGHFVVKHPHPTGDVFVDPFNRGLVLSSEQCAEKVREIYDGAVEFQPCMLGAVTKRQILSRSVHNLKTIYAASREPRKALQMVELLLVIAPWDLDEIRDRGLLRYQLGDGAGAVHDLETYLEYYSEASDADRVRSSVRAIRRSFGGGTGISRV